MKERRARLSLITVARLGGGRPRRGGRARRAFDGRSARYPAQRGAAARWLVQGHARQRRSGPFQDADRAPRRQAECLRGTGPQRGTGAPSNPWRLQATLPNTVIKDISFASPTVGYIAGELGKVWKTTNGGSTWTQIMNLGYPYYWYGVDALSENDVVISGFDNSNWRGLLRWSHDGGQTWSSDVVLTTRGWSMRVRFADAQHGLVLDLINLDGPSVAHYTTNGGQTATDWTTVVLDPDGGWFGNQFSFLTDLKAWASGITYCPSPDGGASWNCRESVDDVFDGPTFFHDDQFGWVGGGSISPTVEGWVHRTADGGQTWSGPDPAGALADPRDPLRDEQPRLGSRRQHLLGRRRPLLLERRRTNVEPRPRLRGSRAGRVRPLEPPARPPEPPGVVRGLRQHFRRQGVHPQALGVERLRGTTFRSRLELLAASSTSSTSTASTGSTGGGLPSRRLAATAS